jgi:hypothetical protein
MKKIETPGFSGRGLFTATGVAVIYASGSFGARCRGEILGLLLLLFLHKQQRAGGGKALPRLPVLNRPLSDATLLILIERIAA